MEGSWRKVFISGGPAMKLDLTRKLWKPLDIDPPSGSGRPRPPLKPGTSLAAGARPKGATPEGRTNVASPRASRNSPLMHGTPQV